MSATQSPSINLPVTEAHARAPRLRVLANGVDLPGAISANVETSNWYRASRFSVELALHADPAFGFSWWAQQSRLLIDVQFSVSVGSWQSVLIGEVDQIDVHPVSGKVLISGRDLVARFQEARTQESFQNDTASRIVTTLAARRGMTANVTATTALAGAYWQIDHVQLTTGQFSQMTNEWDLMVALARHEGFDLYVTGTVLHFHPATPPDAKPFEVRWQPPILADGAAYDRRANITDLRCGRALTLAKTVEVVVRSWNSRTARGFSRTARAIGARSAGAARSATQTGTTSQRYVFVRPNMTEDQAQKFANAMLEDLSRHERTVTFRLPGDLILDPRKLVRLAGTGTDFDQTYYIDHITSQFGFDGGFVMDVAAKNRDARSQAILS